MDTARQNVSGILESILTKVYFNQYLKLGGKCLHDMMDW